MENHQNVTEIAALMVGYHLSIYRRIKKYGIKGILEPESYSNGNIQDSIYANILRLCCVVTMELSRNIIRI